MSDRAAKFDAGDRLVPIRVLARGERPAPIRKLLEQIRVPTARGGGVPLTAVADIRFSEGPISINRYVPAGGRPWSKRTCRRRRDSASSAVGVKA